MSRLGKKTKFDEPGHYDKKDRSKIPTEDFGDPKNEKFPIVTQQDVYDAARLIGHADNEAEVRKHIIEICKRKGFNVPDSWETKEEDKTANRIRGRMRKHAGVDVARAESNLQLLDEISAKAAQLSANWYREFMNDENYPFSEPFDEIALKLNDWYSTLEHKLTHDESF